MITLIAKKFSIFKFLNIDISPNRLYISILKFGYKLNIQGFKTAQTNMNNIEETIREDPSSLYLHSRVGLALKSTLQEMVMGTAFPDLTTEQKLLIQKYMLASMQKDDLVGKAFDALQTSIADPDEAERLDAKLSSVEIKGQVHSYNNYKGTYTLELNKVVIARNKYDYLVRESDDQKMKIIATEFLPKIKK